MFISTEIKIEGKTNLFLLSYRFNIVSKYSIGSESAATF